MSINEYSAGDLFEVTNSGKTMSIFEILHDAGNFYSIKVLWTAPERSKFLGQITSISTRQLKSAKHIKKNNKLKVLYGI